jgi:Zn-dependent M28 family amino/carboxypeptidase
MRRGAVIVLAAAVLATGAASQQAGVDRAQLMRDVSTLSHTSFEGRATGSPGGIRARRWLVERFGEAGIPALAASGYEQRFTAGGRPAANIVGRVRGRAPDSGVIVLTAHFDHLGVRNGVLYPGADDNASGVAALLTAGRELAKEAPHHSFVLAALDAEEMGQRGAQALLASGTVTRRAIVLNINLDMVSRSARRELFAAGTSYAPWLLPVLRDVQRRSAITLRFGHDRPSTADARDDWTHSSDHRLFHDAGIPFVYFGVEDHPDYHKATDTSDRIDPAFFGDAVDTIVDAIRALDAAVPAVTALQ